MKITLNFKTIDEVKLKDGRRYLVICEDVEKNKIIADDAIMDSRWHEHAICSDGSDEGPCWDDIPEWFKRPVMVCVFPKELDGNDEEEVTGNVFKIELDFKPIDEVKLENRKTYILFCHLAGYMEPEKNSDIRTKIIVSDWIVPTKDEPYNWPQLCERWNNIKMVCELPKEILQVNFRKNRY